MFFSSAIIYTIALLLLSASKVLTFIIPFTKNSSSAVVSFHALKNAVNNFIDSIGENNNNNQCVDAEFAKVLNNGPIALKDRDFLISGWRWHTISVLRDLERFKSLSSSKYRSSLDNDRLSKCYNHVFGFNWNALMKVESDIFFPWLSNILPEDSKVLIVTINQKHENIKLLTKSLNNICTSTDTFFKNEATVHKLIHELKDCALSIQNTQENYLVPYISAYISKREQGKFNRKVLSSLGLLNSQIHLVSMYEAIKEKPEEIKIFNKQMPSVARALIPVWRSNFYTPRTSCFD